MASNIALVEQIAVLSIQSISWVKLIWRIPGQNWDDIHVEYCRMSRAIYHRNRLSDRWVCATWTYVNQRPMSLSYYHRHLRRCRMWAFRDEKGNKMYCPYIMQLVLLCFESCFGINFTSYKIRVKQVIVGGFLQGPVKPHRKLYGI